MFMSQSVPKPIYIFLFCSFFFILYDLTHADPPYNICSNTSSFTDNTPFKANLNNLLSSLSSNSYVSKFYNTSIGNESNRVYGLFLCYNYVTNDACRSCISAAVQAIQNLCGYTKEAVVWEELCQFRYSDKNFFGRLDLTGNIPQFNDNHVEESESEQFRSIVNDTLHNLTKHAAFDHLNGMYETREVPFMDTRIIHVLVQCTLDLSSENCNLCLETAITEALSRCNSSRGCRLLSRSCYLRYEFYHFYQDGDEHIDSTDKRKKKWMIVLIASGSVVALLGFLAYCLARRNLIKKRKTGISTQEVRLNGIGDANNIDFLNRNLQRKDSLNPQEYPFINIETITAATDNFSDSNKLGEGGFGPVYKGVLTDGNEVAVKRLSSCSEQDPRKRAQLNWSTRLNIINGIARGILYLHQDSRLRIIHRDLKPNNVLLDEDMNPKISDFGMARIFGGSEGETSTARIVGTYGYMAPEFAMEGLYSIKSDVFSFGVLLIEIITGRRNAGFHLSKHAPSLLAYAWQLWNEGKGSELMDPLLIDSGCFDEFLKCMHIGLLCVQEDAYDRPTMSSVVIMLNSETATFSQPERPALSVGRFNDHHETCYNNLSNNSLTISNLVPR